MLHPLGAPCYPPDSYDPALYQPHPSRHVPAAPDGYQSDSFDSAPHVFRPNGRPPPMIPEVSVTPRVPSSPGSGSVLAPFMVPPPVVVPPTMYPHPQPVVIEAPYSPVRLPVIPMPHIHRNVDRNRRRRLSPDFASYTPARVYTRPAPEFSLEKANADEGPRLNISFDIGTEFSAIAYSGDKISGFRDITSWPGSNESINKIPTCLVYDALGAFQAWGIQAKQMALEKDWTRCKWYVR
jgi:hypothetical protein